VVNNCGNVKKGGGDPNNGGFEKRGKRRSTFKRKQSARVGLSKLKWAKVFGGKTRGKYRWGWRWRKFSHEKIQVNHTQGGGGSRLVQKQTSMGKETGTLTQQGCWVRKKARSPRGEPATKSLGDPARPKRRARVKKRSKTKTRQMG